MTELAMLADIQRTVYPDEVTRQLHVMAQDRESSPVVDQRSVYCATAPTSRWKGHDASGYAYSCSIKVVYVLPILLMLLLTHYIKLLNTSRCILT